MRVCSIGVQEEGRRALRREHILLKPHFDENIQNNSVDMT